jgi:hypothetical protein
LRTQLSTFIGLQHGQSSPDAVMPISVFATCAIAKDAETGEIAKLAASRSAQTRRKLRMQAG